MRLASGASSAFRLMWSSPGPPWTVTRAGRSIAAPALGTTDGPDTSNQRVTSPRLIRIGPGLGVPPLQQDDPRGQEERGPGAEHAESLPGRQELAGRGLVLGDELPGHRGQVGVDVSAPA